MRGEYGTLWNHKVIKKPRTYDEFMVPYTNLVDKIADATAGEGVFVRPGLEAAGLSAGFSRFPSRDDAVTQEIKDGFRQLLESQANT